MYNVYYLQILREILKNLSTQVQKCKLIIRCFLQYGVWYETKVVGMPNFILAITLEVMLDRNIFLLNHIAMFPFFLILDK